MENHVKEFSKSEILLHNSSKDCWIIVFNQVYNITDFLQKHPGGSEILLSRAGEDATSFFQTRHGRNNKIYEYLSPYKIGILPEHERVDEAAFEEPFFDELVKACQRKNLFQVKKEKKRIFHTIRASFLLLNIAIVVSVFYFKLNIGWAIPLVVIQALLSTSLFGLLAHEHTHRVFPENKLLRYLLIGVWPILWPFISRRALIYEHNSHHIKIGDPDHDYEVMAFSHFVRYSGLVQHRTIHKIQHRISFLWYMFYANIITTIGGIFTSFWKNKNRRVALHHNVSILVTVLVFLILPWILHGSFLHFLGLYLLFQCILFSFVYMGAAINHFTPMANQEIPDEMKNKFAYYVCHNTTNFAPNSKFWFFLSGGFNIQIEHHLNAFVPVENLRELRKIVKPLCEKYGYPYIEYGSLSALYRAHYNFLFSMSKPSLDQSIQQEINNKRSFQAR